MSSGRATVGPFLAALAEDDARELRELGRIRRYDAGDAIFHQGDEPGGVSIVLEGCVKVSSVSATGKEVILAVGAEEFRRFLDSHARASMNLVLMLIERLRSADEARMEFASHDVVGRVARRLVELSERFGEPCEEGIEVTLALSQEELAAWTASSREAVAKAMRLLRELGWIETRRRRVVIREIAALRRYAT